ncbi:MAG: GNAT family N-acetyltransferase [Chloroflexi bacterium]|nr:GNAT family N-acetyltransferase [Chloroflexota bacterium]MCI0578637.1 GNAT family N-acetyltransferase [Chloroflexota bacterium]MCI0647210.1 GNAT family N-acetyltransferase [Chloroflexota bacterium]MCI0728936.1 GNAT family N-acetyltransferase [Chloroflexota bacterium]
MLATPVALPSQPKSGPRPIHVGRDMRQVLHLLDLTFGPLLDADGRRLLSDRMSLSYQAPLAMRLSTMTRGFIPGFVWDENGRIVGNLSLIETRLPGRYLIANVAVHPDFRRRGIARTLMVEAIEYLRRRGSRMALLQVETNNTAARHLYEQLNFATVGSIQRWDTTTTRVRPLPLAAADSRLDIRPMRSQEWRDAYALDRASVHPELSWPEPTPHDKYRRSFWQWLAGLLNGQKTEVWLTRHGRQLTGLAMTESEWGRPHTLSLRISPTWRGQLERPLLAKLLRRLDSLRSGAIEITHPAGDEVVNQLLKEANFQPRRSLTIMRLDLQGL